MTMLRPRLSINLKLLLLQLNRDIETIKRDIEFSVRESQYATKRAPLESMPVGNIERAVLSLEDKRFFAHSGVEFRGLLRALKRKLQGKRFGGLSTIDQQVVRISTGRYERTFERKFRELVLAYLLNYHVSKVEMLHFYLAQAYFGTGMIGAHVASDWLFEKQLSELDWSESAFLAALLPSPMPSEVSSLIVVRGPIIDIGEFLALAETRSPRWTAKFRHRYRIALRNQDFIPKSLSIR